MNTVLEDALTGLDLIEPQSRSRSNTWPLPRPENYVEAAPAPTAATVVPTKKTSKRRGIWKNFTYADLIIQAITSSPGLRMTLSQIYAWMKQNVPSLKDNGDVSSSAGWKNSVRHNLSLHDLFMRVDNEEVGQSSWWMINPDPKPKKSTRRRAASMEAGKFERSRGRVKKAVEVMRNGALPHIIGGGFQLNPDVRYRASSNASTGGRLSPIPDVGGYEPDWSQFNSSPEMPGNYSPTQLAGNLGQGIKLQPDAYLGYINEQTTQQPPPYTALYEQCIRSCSCMQIQFEVERMPSPSYPYSEPPPDPTSPQYLINRSTLPNPSLNSSPFTPQPTQGPPSTMMGQSMGAINSSTVPDDLNINVEPFQGGFDCNVEELITYELGIEGNLDFNFSNQQQTGVP